MVSSHSAGIGLHVPRDLPLPPRNSKGPSHAKKNPGHHTPKPRNPFILFRCWLETLGCFPKSIAFCSNHRQVSRIASWVWLLLPRADREVFFELAEEEKRQHARKHPEYSLPAPSRKSPPCPVGRTQDEMHLKPEEIVCKRIGQLIVDGLQGAELILGIERVLAELGPLPCQAKKSKPPPSSPRKPRASISLHTVSSPSSGRITRARAASIASNQSDATMGDSACASSPPTSHLGSPSRPSTGEPSSPTYHRATSTHSVFVRQSTPLPPIEPSYSSVLSDVALLESVEDAMAGAYESPSGEYDGSYCDVQAINDLVRQNQYLVDCATQVSQVNLGYTTTEPEPLTVGELVATFGEESVQYVNIPAVLDNTSRH